MNVHGTCAGVPAVRAGGGVLPPDVRCLTVSGAMVSAVGGEPGTRQAAFAAA